MKVSIITTLLLIFLAVPCAEAQQLVTLNRNKLKTEHTTKSKTKKPTNKQKKATGSKKRTSSRHTYSYRRHQTYSKPKEASYLRINNQYGDDITYYSTYPGDYNIFQVSTDGQDYSVEMLPSWCHLTNKYSGSFTLYIDSNTSHKDRSDWFVVRSNNQKVTVHLKQSGKPVPISASYYSNHLTHGYKLNGVRYMKINATLRVSGAPNSKLLAMATVQDENGTPIYAASGYSDYTLSDGTFFTMSEFTSTNDDNSVYNVTFYIPNNALRLYNKDNNLTCRLSLYCEKTAEFVSNANCWIPFYAKYKRGKVTTTNR